MPRIKYPVIALVLLSPLIAAGCFPFFLFGGPHSVYEFSSMKSFVDKTLDIKDSSPDLIIFADKNEILHILRNIDADRNFEHKKIFLKNAWNTYLQNGIIQKGDCILATSDDIGNWVSIIILKESKNKTLLWFRKPQHKSAPISSFANRDWLSMTRDECIARGINVR